MAHFELRISGDIEELSGTAAQVLSLFQPAGPAPVDAAGLSAQDKPKRGKKTTEPEVGAVEAATAASPATERPTPAVQQTAEQIAHVDPAVLAAQQGGDPAAPGSPSNQARGATAEQAEAKTIEGEKTSEVVVETPAATAEPVTGEVTRDMLNVAMTELLKVTSAAKAQATIAAATGGEQGGKKALGALDVSEYPAVLQALKNATAAASAA